ncbi:Hydrogen peroxide-inducible genes activator [Methylacidimicrobium cyclopophantes]|uniref:Hydrogen peroxide-inducible genes activator n=1 Tax=Methylacidimicrobium cyclopophantes TaxID=1041766 RepID=A0A5E6MG67_9BACT|nr:LysR family transcriptional regulator [Methylacidimicrobium cyclopophantes]VVM08469.1 Hydrogen peroxide-inducible genes activator [Methylacidimicrobium cyclopophantes]
MEPTIDLRQLQAFLAVAESGSFTRASRKLHRSQPAVSRTVAALEEELGVGLFERFGKRIALTQAGQILVSRSRRLLAETASLREELRASEQSGAGSLRLAADPSACQHLLPAILREFKESFPACAWTILAANAFQSLEWVREKRVEVAMVTRPLRLPALIRFEPLFEEEWVFAVTGAHPWAADRTAPARDLERYRYLLPDEGSESAELIERYFARRGVRLPVLASLGSAEAIGAMAAQGLGIGILPSWVLGGSAEPGKLVPIPFGRNPLRRSWGLLRLKGRRPGLAEHAFLALCRSIVPRRIQEQTIGGRSLLEARRGSE